MLDQVFSNLATGFAAQFGAPFGDAVAVWAGTPTLDAGGSIVAVSSELRLDCKAQFDAPTHAMRQTEGFRETDARIIVLSASLAGTLDARAKIVVAAGQNAGTWELLSVVRDPAGIGYECRARRV